MPTDLTIRPAVAEDLAGVARVYIDSAQHHLALDPAMYKVPSVEEIHARYLGRIGEQKTQVTLVAIWNGEVVGLVDAQMLRSTDAMLRAEHYCHVAELAVAEQHRSRGVGERLLKAAEEWGQEHGAEVVALEFHVANVRAGRFYQERMGYRIASSTAVKPLIDRT